MIAPMSDFMSRLRSTFSVLLSLPSFYVCLLCFCFIVFPFLHTCWVIHLFLFFYISIPNVFIDNTTVSHIPLYHLLSFFLSLRISCQSLLFFMLLFPWDELFYGCHHCFLKLFPFELSTSSKRFYFPFTISEYICLKFKSFWSFIW